MIEFRRNKETGILEVWKDGKKWCFNEYTPIDDN